MQGVLFSGSLALLQPGRDIHDSCNHREIRATIWYVAAKNPGQVYSAAVPATVLLPPFPENFSSTCRLPL